MMDETPEYILKCQKARKELLDVWEPKSGDYVYNDMKKEVRVLYFSDEHGDPPEKYTAGVFSMWLPRQDQLQEMIDWFKYTKLDFCNGTNKAYKLMLWVTLESPGSYWIHGNSMEQLWLAFVMKEKYNKVWNGEDWVSA